MKPPLVNYFLWIILALVYSSPAMAAETQDVSILNTVTQSMSIAATDKIGPMALGWFGALVSLQFVITNFSALKSGADIQEVFAKLIGLLFSIGISMLLITNGPDFIDSVGHGVFSKFLSDIPSAGAIITATLGICTTLSAAIFAIGMINTAVAILLVNVVIVVFGIGMYMAMKVFMLYLELGMVILLSPLSFSFLGLSALRDQGIAPLKSLISLIYRAVLLGIIYSAFAEIINVAGDRLSAINWVNPLAWPGAVNIVLSMLCAYPIIAYLAYKSDSIASSLAGGSTNMGPADVASAAAAGAAAGAAAMTGGSSAAGAIAQVPSMKDFIKGLASGGAISNASGVGAGSTPMGSASMPTPSMSKSTGGSPAGAKNSSPATHGTTVGMTLPNGSPRPSANTQTASNAADGVLAAGGSQAASNAAAAAALAGDSNAAVSAAVVQAGGTEAQGAAAATAMAIGEAGGSSAAVKSGAQAVGAGMNAEDVGQAVMNTVASGSALGESREVGAAAASASRTKPTQVQGAATAASTSGENGAIADGSSSSDQKHDAVIQAIQQQGQARKPTSADRVKELNHHVAQEKATTSVSINAHHTD